MASSITHTDAMHTAAAVYGAAMHAYRSMPAKGFPACGGEAVRSDTVLEWTMMAAIIVSDARSPSSSSFEPLVVATGTRCLGPDSDCTDGSSVRDMHAEVLAVRSLRLILSREMHRHQQECSARAACVVPHALLSHDSSLSNFTLQPHLQLHMYISDSPCGSASEYADRDDMEGEEGAGARRSGAKRVHDAMSTSTVDAAPQLRVKSYRSDLPPHKRTRSMCCSDKLCRWMALGLQGRALARVLAPVYLNSITISHEETGTDAFWASYAASSHSTPQGVVTWPRMSTPSAVTAVAALDATLGVTAPELRPQARACVRSLHGRVCAALNSAAAFQDVCLPAVHVTSQRFIGGRTDRFAAMADARRKRARMDATSTPAGVEAVVHPRPHACALTCVWTPPTLVEPVHERELKVYTHAKGHASVEVLTGAKGWVQGSSAGHVRPSRVSKLNLAALAAHVTGVRAHTYAELKMGAPDVYTSAVVAFYAAEGPFSAWNHADPRADAFPALATEDTAPAAATAASHDAAATHAADAAGTVASA